MNTAVAPKVKLIAMEPVKSSCLAAYGYDASTQTLRVRFNHSVELHDYTEFSPKKWDEMRNAPSIGGYFTTSVRNHYPHELVPKDDDAEHEGVID
jgi:hypothetical protein